MLHKKIAFFCLAIMGFSQLNAQRSTVTIEVLDNARQPLALTTVEMLRSRDSGLLKAQMTDSNGIAVFDGVHGASYVWRISRVGHQTVYTPAVDVADGAAITLPSIVLQLRPNQMADVTIRSTRPFIEMRAGKTVANIESSITSVGATAMEVLEKLPGIMVDRDGNISIKGKGGVNVLIDGKPTYLDPTQLATMLNGMSATQISQIEIMENPGARYDAAGNAGIINIKMKKNRQLGFNGSFTTAYSQGRLPKNNNNLVLNYRNGKWNIYANYSTNWVQQYMDIYALRTYFQNDGKTVASYLEQPSYIRNNSFSHNIRTGVDYALSAKTNISLNLNSFLLDRTSTSNNRAEWQGSGGNQDSLIRTYSRNTTDWKMAGANLHLKHSFSADREWTTDVDLIGYRLRGNQFFENNSVQPVVYSEATKAALPGDIRIISAKTDYNMLLGKYKLETGLKTTHTSTDNLADYEYRDGIVWYKDYGKTNHFLYDEQIHAVYASAETKMKRLTLQAGLRYEATSYNAHQLGNIIVKDSAFSNSYNSLFPTVFASFEKDSVNSFSFSAGRRIDRPPFQRLNPFLFVINKYTYERGNPFYKPQYSWNIEVGHSYKNKIMTGLSYSITKDYFSQIFPIDSTGIVYYTVGNMGSMHNLGFSLSLQLAPAKWWSFNFTGMLNRKIMKGVIDRAYEAEITQLHINLANQFRFGKQWSAELGGYYTSKSQHDIQEIVEPAGQLSVGVSKTILKSKGTVKLAFRDIFHTQWMEGLTYFTNSTEYFKFTRDTRVLNLSFTYRFGKSFKQARRSQGAAGDVIERMGNG